MHVDPASMQPSLDLDQTDGDIPEGAMRFQVEAQDIADCLSAPSPQVPTPKQAESALRYSGHLPLPAASLLPLPSS